MSGTLILILVALIAVVAGMFAGVLMRRISWHWLILGLLFLAVTWAIGQLTFGLAADWTVAQRDMGADNVLEAASNTVGAVFTGSLNGMISVMIVTASWLIGTAIGVARQPASVPVEVAAPGEK